MKTYNSNASLMLQKIQEEQNKVGYPIIPPISSIAKTLNISRQHAYNILNTLIKDRKIEKTGEYIWIIPAKTINNKFIQTIFSSIRKLKNDVYICPPAAELAKICAKKNTQYFRRQIVIIGMRPIGTYCKIIKNEI